MPELIDRVLASPGELTILAIGRQTNVALAVSIEPRFAESAAEIIVMGGSILQPGNISPLATANIGGDPEAADAVYRSGGRVTQVGLDVVNSTEISGCEAAAGVGCGYAGDEDASGGDEVHQRCVSEGQQAGRVGRSDIFGPQPNGVRDCA